MPQNTEAKVAELLSWPLSCEKGTTRYAKQIG